MGNFGAPELLIILAIVALLFGSTRLPKMARSLGQASKEFKKGVSEGRSDGDDDAAGTDEVEGDGAEKAAATADDTGAGHNGSRTAGTGDSG